MKSVGKPDAGNPHVRFDERGRETERLATPQATAPFLDSTICELQFLCEMGHDGASIAQGACAGIPGGFSSFVGTMHSISNLM
jgi:hypothetical protein